MKKVKTERRYGKSNIISVKYHEDELAIIDKNKKGKKRSVYIREKSLK